MMYRVPLFAALVIGSCASATAADLPPIRTSERNVVPECVTPGRLMAFLRSRNLSLDPSFEKIAVHYMRYGEQLGLRWDYAFVQMLIETGYLTFKRDGNKNGLVRPSQNNFAGLGAVGKGEHGESFKDVPTGVLAHLQHVLLYAGELVADPVAERTRKVAEWGVLTPWQSKIKGPITYTQLARRWAASSSYAEAIASHAAQFQVRFCNAPDPDPDLVREARSAPPATPRRDTVATESPRPAVSGADLARQAIEDGKAEGNNTRSSLGAAFLARIGDDAASGRWTDPAEADTREAKPGDASDARAETALMDITGKPDRSDKAASVQTASAAAALAKPQPPAATAPKCRVWTASYGGQKAILIRVQKDGALNYTVLDVNEGAEKREADAYIAAYARGGTIAGEFSSPSQALDKAFELCPES